MWHFHKISKDDVAKARQLLRLASEQAPEFANAYAGLAFIAYAEFIFGYATDHEATLEQGLRETLSWYRARLDRNC